MLISLGLAFAIGAVAGLRLSVVGFAVVGVATLVSFMLVTSGLADGWMLLIKALALFVAMQAGYLAAVAVACLSARMPQEDQESRNEVGARRKEAD